MKKVIAVLLSVITISAAVPAMAHGHGNRASCANNGICESICTTCGNAMAGGICTSCGKTDRLYQRHDSCQGLHKGHGCHR